MAGSYTLQLNGDPNGIYELIWTIASDSGGVVSAPTIPERKRSTSVPNRFLAWMFPLMKQAP